MKRIDGVNYAHIKTTPNAINMCVFDLDTGREFSQGVVECDTREGEGWCEVYTNHKRNDDTHRVYGNFELRTS